MEWDDKPKTPQNIVDDLYRGAAHFHISDSFVASLLLGTPSEGMEPSEECRKECARIYSAAEIDIVATGAEELKRFKVWATAYGYPTELKPHPFLALFKDPRTQSAWAAWCFRSQ